MNMPEQPTLESLLAETEWVRGLARALVDRSDLADDVVQDVWVAALERSAPPVQSMRGWLVQVVRNSVRKSWRNESRRREREERVARPVELPSTLDLVERVSTQQAVGAAVLGLGEPYREAVLLRYYEDLGLREIAERTGVAVSTVDWRLRRALGELHRALDRHTGEDRTRSVLALAALAGRPGASASASGAAASLAAWAGGGRAAPLAAGTLLVAVSVVTFMIHAGRRAPVPYTASVPPAEVLSAPGEIATSTVSRSARRTPAGVGAPAPSGVPTIRVASLAVRVVAADGLGAAGVPLRLTPEFPPAGAPAPGVARTDADGRVRFAGLPTGRYRVESPFDAAHLVELEAVGPKRLEIRLPAGSALTGIVEDELGLPVAGASLWLSCEGPESWVGGSAVPSFVDDVPAAVSDAEGRFALPSVGRARLVGAYARGFAPSLARRLALRPGPSQALRIVLSGPGATVTGNVLDDRGRAVNGAFVFIDAAGGPGLGGGEVPAPLLRTRTDARGQFEFDSVRSGRRRIVASAPGLTSRRSFVQVPGQGACQITLALARGARIFGTVHTGSGAPAVDVLVYAARRRWRSLPDARYCAAMRTDADGHYDLSGIRPGAVWITVDGGELGQHQELLAERVEDELELNIQLTRGPEIRGMVVDEAGRALAGCQVLVAPEGRWRGRSRTTDEGGRFALSNCEDGPHTVLVVEHGVRVARRSLTPGEREVTIEVRDRDRPSAELRGTLVDADGLPVAVRELQLTPAGGGRATLVPVRALGGGGFRSTPILPGTYSVTVLADGRVPLTLEGTSRLVRQAALDLGLLELAAAGPDFAVQESATPTPAVEPAARK